MLGPRLQLFDVELLLKTKRPGVISLNSYNFFMAKQHRQHGSNVRQKRGADHRWELKVSRHFLPDNEVNLVFQINFNLVIYIGLP